MMLWRPWSAIDQILPDGFSVASARQPGLDDFPPGFARTRRRTPAWPWVRHDNVLVSQLSAKVGDHLIGRFCRCSPTPSARRVNRNPGGSQLAADSLRADMYRRFNAPQRPSQPPSAMTCCFFLSLKTLLTLTEGNPRVRINVPDQFVRWPVFK